MIFQPNKKKIIWPRSGIVYGYDNVTRVFAKHFHIVKPSLGKQQKKVPSLVVRPLRP